MLHPFLFIGVGGSGGKTLRTLRNDLELRLMEVGYEGRWPSCWQFLHIDVPTVADGNEQGLPAQLDEKDYIGLVGRSLDYQTIDDALIATGRTDEQVLRNLVGWRPEPRRVTVPITRGAGQYRVLGRVITLTNLAAVGEALRESLQALHGPEMSADLSAVSRAFGLESRDNPPEPQAVVVSSLAGGSGSGAFLDICDALRAVGGGGSGWTDESFGVLYAPDVFNHLDPEARKGVHANALAALCELMSGFWDLEPRPADFAIMEGRGIAVGAPRRSGPRFPLIVGTKNDKVGFKHQNDVYMAMGKALAAWVCSENLQEKIKSYSAGNWALSAALLPDKTGLRAAEQEEPLSAIGFARVSLGRDTFAAYASERLARRAVDRIMRQHLADRSPDADANHEAAINEMVTARFASFLEESGLNERTEDHNQILDALRPLDREERLATATAEVRRGVTAGRSNAVPARTWLAETIAFLQEQQTSFADEETARRNERAREWVKSIQEQLLRLVSLSVASNGAPVTEKLLERLRMELDYVLTELPDEEAKYRHWATQLDQLVSDVLQPTNDALQADNPLITQAITKGLDCYDYLAEAELRKFAAALVKDAVQNLIEPLQRALRSGRELLATRESPAEGHASVVDGWPVGDLMPRRFQPAGNEFLLESVDDYPSLFKSVVTRSALADDPGGAESEFVRHTILGSKPTDRDAQDLIAVHTAWVPGVSELQTAFGTAARAQFEFRLAPVDVLVRARRLVDDRDSPLGEFVGESLQNYLDEQKVEPGELARRLDKFHDAFVQALETSSPLVNIDPRVLTRVHEVTAPKVGYVFTEIPFPEGTAGYESVRRVLESRGQWTEDLRSAFTEGRQARIDVFSMLMSSYNPVVFESIVGPIADEWQRRKATADGRAGFWRWRRARPLSNFVPAAPEVRMAMIRGWFTARLLGELSFDDDDREVMRIWDPSMDRLVDFPYPLLGPPVFEDPERLPAILESLPLAMIEFAERSTDGDMALAPYWRLRDLGTDARGAMDYERANPAIESWIARGMATPGAPGPNTEMSGPVGDGPDAAQERKNACQQQVQKWHKNYDGLVNVPLTTTSFFEAPRAMAIGHDLMGALSDLDRAIGRVSTARTDSDF